MLDTPQCGSKQRKVSGAPNKRHNAQPLTRLAALGAVFLLVGCESAQSTFSPFGEEAASTLRITWAMIIAAALITVGVLGLAWHAAHAREGSLDLRGGMRVILWLGAIAPTLILAAMLVYSLPSMRTLQGAPGDMRIAVNGEQFWWRVRYLRPGGQPVETANEIRLPVGRTVTFHLASPDVIHSFWIPGLAGKLDMIPGRTNDLVVRATRAGTFRGVCAEFCGLSHARMAFDVIAMEPGEFAEWLAEAGDPATALDVPGRKLFGEYGCIACHSVRGHFAGGGIGPDLTHFGSRRSFAAGTLPITRAAIGHFIRHPAATKPGARMPSFAEMPDADADAISTYLMELR